MSEFKPTKKQKKEKLDQAIILLDEITKIKVAPSSIQGVGVFAMRDVKKGEKLYTDAIPQQLDIPYKDFKKLRPEVASYILGRWPLVSKGSHFLYPDTRFAAFLNHSYTPNYDAKNDKTLSKIKAGEEITEDYRKIDGWQEVFPWIKR